MDYLEQLKSEAALREAQSAFTEMRKATVMRIMELSSVHGRPYLLELEEFNRRYDGSSDGDPAHQTPGPYKGHGNGGG